MGAALKDCNCGTLNLKRFFVAVETLAHLRMGFFSANSSFIRFNSGLKTTMH